MDGSSFPMTAHSRPYRQSLPAAEAFGPTLSKFMPPFFDAMPREAHAVLPKDTILHRSLESLNAEELDDRRILLGLQKTAETTLDNNAGKSGKTVEAIFAKMVGDLDADSFVAWDGPLGRRRRYQPSPKRRKAGQDKDENPDDKNGQNHDGQENTEAHRTHTTGRSGPTEGAPERTVGEAAAETGEKAGTRVATQAGTEVVEGVGEKAAARVAVTAAEDVGGRMAARTAVAAGAQVAGRLAAGMAVDSVAASATGGLAVAGWEVLAVGATVGAVLDIGVHIWKTGFTWQTVKDSWSDIKTVGGFLGGIIKEGLIDTGKKIKNVAVDAPGGIADYIIGGAKWLIGDKEGARASFRQAGARLDNAFTNAADLVTFNLYSVWKEGNLPLLGTALANFASRGLFTPTMALFKIGRWAYNHPEQALTLSGSGFKLIGDALSNEVFAKNAASMSVDAALASLNAENGGRANAAASTLMAEGRDNHIVRQATSDHNLTRDAQAFGNNVISIFMGGGRPFEVMPPQGLMVAPTANGVNINKYDAAIRPAPGNNNIPEERLHA